MDIKSAEDIYLGTQEVLEVWLAGVKVWPTAPVAPVITYSLTNASVVYSNGLTYVYASGSGYAYITATYNVFENGVLTTSTTVTCNQLSLGTGSNSTSWYTSGNNICAYSRGTTVGNMGGVTVTASYNNGTETILLDSTLIVYQQANEATYIEGWSSSSISLSSDKFTSASPCSPLGSGTSGVATITYYGYIMSRAGYYTYTSGAGGYPAYTYTNLPVSTSLTSGVGSLGSATQSGTTSTGIPIYTQTFSFPSMGTTLGTRSSVVTATANSATTKTVLLYQGVNSIVSSTYGTAAFTATAYNNPTSASGNGYWTYSAYRIRTDTYTTGSTATETEFATSFTLSPTSSPINITLSQISWPYRSNVEGASRSVVVTTNQGASLTFTQEANVKTVTTSYSISAISTTSTGSPSQASGGSSSANYYTINGGAVTRSVVTSWSSGYPSSTVDTSMGTATFSSSNAGLTISGTKAYWSSEGTSYLDGRSATITASYSEATSVTTSVSQNANTFTVTSYGISLNLGASSISASGGTISYTAQGVNYGTYASGSSEITYSSAVSVSSNNSAFLVNTTLSTITIDSNTAPDSRIATITASYNGASTNATITQAANLILVFNPTSGAYQYSGESKTTSITANVGYSVVASQIWISLNKTGGSSGTESLAISVSANTAWGSRIGYVTATGISPYSSAVAVYTVEQAMDTTERLKDSGTVSVTYIENTDGLARLVQFYIHSSWTVSNSTSWITCSPTSGTYGDKSVTIDCSTYTYSGTIEYREADILIKVGSQTKFTIHIKQYNISEPPAS